MPLAITCTCGRALNLRDELAGKLIVCPACKAAVRVPAFDVVEEVMAGPPPTLPKPPARPKVVAERNAPRPPPLPTAIKPPAEPTPHEEPPEEDIPEFENLEEVDDEEVRDESALKVSVNLDGDDDDAWEQAQLAQLKVKDEPKQEADWDNASLREEPASAMDQAMEVRPAADDDGDNGPATYSFGADTGTGLDTSLVGPQSKIRLDADFVSCLAYGADHKTHLAADADEIFVLDFKKRRSMLLKRMHSAPILCMCISPDCRQALSGDEDGGLMLWDLANCKPVRWLDGHRSDVTALAFSPNGMYAASGGAGGAVWLWEVATGKRLALQQGQFEDPINCLCFAPDGQRLAAICDNSRVRLWNVADRRSIGRFPKGADDLRSVAFTKNGAMLLAGSGNRFKVCKWNASSGERERGFLGFNNRQPRVSRTWICGDGNCLVVMGFKLKVPPKILDIQEDAPFPLLGHFTLAWRASREVIHLAQTIGDSLTGSIPIYYLELWDAVNERGLGNVPLGPEIPPAVACSPDGHRAIAGYRDGVVLLLAL